MSAATGGPAAADGRSAVVRATTAEDTRALGRAVAGLLRGGDLVVLSGDLGAGKTTFTQGLGAGLGVRGDVTSPTFVIARVHPSLAGGPALVHVDAYRLRPSAGAALELDDLDLDASADDAVTVVEWGAGLAEVLSEDRLEVELTRRTGSAAAVEPEDGVGTDEARTLRLLAVGPRWAEVDLPSALAGLSAAAGGEADAGAPVVAGPGA